MENYILYLFENIAKQQELKNKIQIEITKNENDHMIMFSKLKEAVKNGENEKMLENLRKEIIQLSNEHTTLQDKKSFGNMYVTALYNAALKAKSFEIFGALQDSKGKIENVPCRYKKVKNIIENLSDNLIKCYYNSYYHTIHIYVIKEPSIHTDLYITKNYSEPVIDFERVENELKQENTQKTADEILKNVEKFAAARKELEKLKNDYDKKVSEIKAANDCIGLYFNENY